jgi:hypothetical protein
MPEKQTLRRASKDKAEGKSASTQAGEFVRQEMDHIRHGKHGARSTKQAIAIGLSEARRAGVKLKAPGRGASASTKRQAARDSKPHGKPSARRSRATQAALKREPRAAASKAALSRQATAAAKRRSQASRSATARKAAQTRKSHRA